MEAKTLRNAIKEAEDFIAVAKKVQIKKVIGTHQMAGKTWESIEDYTKQNSAVKRASMDLTRILADLRQGR